MADPAEAPEAWPQLDSFPAVAQLFAERREAILHAHIRNNLHLVRFEIGRIEVRPSEHAPSNLTNRMGELLTKWTGRRWVVSVSREEGAQTERTRVSGIFAHEAAAGRTQLAIQCVTSGLSVEQAGAVLGVAPAATAAPVNAFATALAAVGNPEVTGVEAGSGAQTDEAALASQIVASFRGSR